MNGFSFCVLANIHARQAYCTVLVRTVHVQRVYEMNALFDWTWTAIEIKFYTLTLWKYEYHEVFYILCVIMMRRLFHYCYLFEAVKARKKAVVCVVRPERERQTGKKRKHEWKKEREN